MKKNIDFDFLDFNPVYACKEIKKDVKDFIREISYSKNEISTVPVYDDDWFGSSFKGYVEYYTKTDKLIAKFFVSEKQISNSYKTETVSELIEVNKNINLRLEDSDIKYIWKQRDNERKEYLKKYLKLIDSITQIEPIKKRKLIDSAFVAKYGEYSTSWGECGICSIYSEDGKRIFEFKIQPDKEAIQKNNKPYSGKLPDGRFYELSIMDDYAVTPWL